MQNAVSRPTPEYGQDCTAKLEFSVLFPQNPQNKFIGYKNFFSRAKKCTQFILKLGARVFEVIYFERT